MFSISNSVLHYNNCPTDGVLVLLSYYCEVYHSKEGINSGNKRRKINL